MDQYKTWRIIYRIDTDAILIIDVCRKTTHQTPKRVSMIAEGVPGSTRRYHERVEWEMDAAKRKRFEAAGWSVGSAKDFLKLSPEEAAFVELKLRLSDSLKQRRQSKSLSQAALAKKIKSSPVSRSQDGGR